MEIPIPRLKPLIEGVALLLVLAVPQLGAAQELPAELRVSVHIPLSPFDHVTYEFKQLGSTPAIALTRFHADDYGSDSEVGLVSADAYAAAMESAGVCRSAGATTERPESMAVGWLETEAIVDGQALTNLLRADTDPAAHDACLDAVRAIVSATLRVDAYQMPFWDDGEFGTLRATANLPARLYLDGRATGLVTPVNALRLDPGVREVRWVAVVTGQEVRQSVTVVAGMTTQVTATFEESLPASAETD